MFASTNVNDDLNQHHYDKKIIAVSQLLISKIAWWLSAFYLPALSSGVLHVPQCQVNSLTSDDT